MPALQECALACLITAPKNLKRARFETSWQERDEKRRGKTLLVAKLDSMDTTVHYHGMNMEYHYLLAGRL
jgi:hypothetical protein